MKRADTIWKKAKIFTTSGCSDRVVTSSFACEELIGGLYAYSFQQASYDRQGALVYQ